MVGFWEFDLQVSYLSGSSPFKGFFHVPVSFSKRMKITPIATSFCLFLVGGAFAKDEDVFKYGETNGNEYGPEDWNQVECVDHATCVSIEVASLFLMLPF